MIIHNKIANVYDIEVFSNVFSCIVKNTETKEVKVFEISERKNDVADLVVLFSNTKLIFIGYNNKHYDDPIINFILLNKDTMPNDVGVICATLKRFSDKIIESETAEDWKTYKYANLFESLDLLTMLFSQKLRVGLKEMQVTMHFPNVREYEGSFENELPLSEIPNMLSYNRNDVDSTEELLYQCESQVRLREGIEKEYGVNVLSKDGMTIGIEILKVKYLEKTHKSWWDIKDLRSPCDIIDLNDVIFPFIRYETPVLQDILKEMKAQKVSPGRKGYEKHFLLDNVEVTVGVGGIHTKNDPEIIIPNDNERLLDSDVNSLYPSLIISYGLVPKHLGKEFLDIYSEIRTERLEAKRNKQKIKNETLKLALNGATGNYQNEHSWLYDPVAVLKIRINGQLLLLMLAEKLLKVGAHIKQLNTDGILYTIPKNADYQKVLNDWEQTTKLSLETEEFEAFYQFAINDYLAVGKGYSQTKDKNLLKYKGLFIEKNSLGKGMQPAIIPKAINNYLVNNVPIEETVKASRDINDFLTYQKVDKKFTVEYNNQLVPRINRYYASTNGNYLYRCVVTKSDEMVPMCIIHTKDGHTVKVPSTELNIGGKWWASTNIESTEATTEFQKAVKYTRSNYANLLKASGITIVNDLSVIKEFPSNINYQYYIQECNKIIEPLKTVQLTLF